MNARLITGDCRQCLETLPAESCQSCITSPPYFRLRNYGGGNDELGREQSPDEYVENLCGVFREVRGCCAGWHALDQSWRYVAEEESTSDSVASSPGAAKRRLDCSQQGDLAQAEPDPEGQCGKRLFDERLRRDIVLPKTAQYYFDQDSIRQPHETDRPVRNRTKHLFGGHQNNGKGLVIAHPLGKRCRDVWTVPTGSGAQPTSTIRQCSRRS